MFSDVEKYKDIEFWKENPVIEFNTIYHDYKWKVIAVFLTNADEKDDNGYVFNYIYPFMSGENYAEYFDEIASRSLYSTGIDVNTDDKMHARYGYFNAPRRDKRPLCSGCKAHTRR